MTATTTELHLPACTAEDLMTANPVSIRRNATVREAMQLLGDRGVSAAPVIDEAGRPVGVVSQSDLLAHLRETPVEVQMEAPHARSEVRRKLGGEADGFEIEQTDPTLVRDVMTPAVFSVRPGATAEQIVKTMTSLNVHRLFVVDRSGVLVGVVSTLDVLKRMVG